MFSLPILKLPSGTTNFCSIYFSERLVRFVSIWLDHVMVKPGFDSRQGQEIFSVRNVQTGSRAHLAFYSMAAGSYFSEDNVGKAENWRLKSTYRRA